MWEDDKTSAKYIEQIASMSFDEIKKMYEGDWWNTATEKTEEELLREKHPGLQELWDQYQAMLRLVK